MKTILEIKKPSSNSHIFWEHALKSAVAFVGTFALLFFGPMLLDAKTSRPSDESTGLGFIIVQFVLEHPEFQYGMSFLAVIVCNIFILRTNRTTNYVVGLSVDDETAILTLTNLYFHKTTEISIPLDSLEYEIQTNTSDDGEKSSMLWFIDQRTTARIGTIKPSHTLWNSQLAKVREALATLNEMGVKKSTKSTKKGFGIGWIFKRY